MNRKVFNYLEMAGKLALSNNRERNFYIASIGLRKDGAIVSAINGFDCTPNYALHSEFRLAKKLDVGSIVYVARIRLDTMNFGLARPCFSCMKALKNKGCIKVYYSVAPGEYGVIDQDAIQSFSKAEYLY